MPEESERLRQLTAALKTALKSRDRETATALRLVLAGLQNLKIAKRAELTDEEVKIALGKEVKKRAEAKEIYTQAGRKDLAAKEEFEEKIIRQWL